ncbi:MAG: MATE family efflux transporter [Acidobacteriota bacterium]
MTVRGELRALARLAAPVAAAQLGMMMLGTVDAMMLGRVSEQALAAGALGNTLVISLQIFALGVLMALDPLVAQAWGAGDDDAIARHLQRGLALAAVLSLPLTAVMWQTDWLLRALGQPAELIEPTARYIRIVGLSNLPFFLFIALRRTLQARSEVWQPMATVAVGNLLNAGVNWVLIFGNFGLPRLEVVGSACATVMTRCAMLGLLFWLARPLVMPSLRTFRRAVLRPRGYLPMLRLGVPAGFMVSLELWMFSASALAMGRFGTTALAAHEVALTLAAMAFMVPLGVAGAAATRVGNAIGRGDQTAARLSMRVSLGFGVAVMSISASAFALAPELLARAFTTERGVIGLAVLLLPIAALFQLADGLQVVAAGVLRGAGDTRVPAALAFVGYWMLGLPLGLGLAFGAEIGPRGLWLGMTGGLFAAALLLTWRVQRIFAGPLHRLADPG